MGILTVVLVYRVGEKYAEIVGFLLAPDQCEREFKPRPMRTHQSSGKKRELFVENKIPH